VLDRLHPDLEWEENPDVYPGLDRIYRGHDGFLKRDRDAFDVWEWIRVEDQEFIDAGPRRGVPAPHWKGQVQRGRG